MFVLPRYLSRFYLPKTEIGRMLFLSVSFSALLLAARIFYTGTPAFIFLGWNLFLAFLPYVITIFLARNPAWVANKWTFGVAFFTWLVFIPNSFYIITDLFHLRQNWNSPIWFDLLLILSFAWNGLLMWILSIRQMEKFIAGFWGKRHELYFLFPIMWLNALGVFIGRYLRFNSWDIVTNPFRLGIDMVYLVTHPITYKNAWGMIFCFSFFMTLLYLSIKRISKLIW